MTTQQNPTPPLKIMMLHGYTQNGPLFHAKTKALEKHLQKAFPGIILNYPTGPLRLDPKDVPGFDAAKADSSLGADLHGWWRRSSTADPPNYLGLDEGMSTAAKVIETEGPFDGVLGFSQGGALAAMVASLLEGPSRQEAFRHFRSTNQSLSIPYPASFEALKHGPLKFCIVYSGFMAPGERYQGFYGHPHIETPSCHFIGSLDSVVEESRPRALIEACGGEPGATVIYHPGGHFVPSGKQYLDALVEFIRATIQETSSDRQTQQEQRAEDMDMPF